ncbi:MAG TPA: DEAD/DEAH box helicase [Candidatus Saccharimonadales bacterium]|nr:DEAD/DEAH box helicase [Candidatus Saccharimonadales bacterium]
MYGHVKTRSGPRLRGSFGGRARRGAPKNNIDCNLYINKAVDFATQENEIITHRFNDFSLSQAVMAQVEKRGYLTPTPIQDKAIPHIMAGRDVIGIADTGTGKTAAFLLPLLHKFNRDPHQKALIMAPTRELAVQINDELKIFSQGMNMRSALCIGGSGFGTQVNALRSRPQFIIGTPGRLNDHLNRQTLYLKDVNNLIVDEADRMVEMGFIDDVRKLIREMPEQRQSLFFSATITGQVQGLIGTFAKNPVTISIKKRDTSQNVEQDIVRYTDSMHRMKLLHELLSQEEFGKVLIFGRTKHGVEKLSIALNERGFNAVSIHGNKNQNQRQKSLDDFKRGRAKILVATDVAARGLDIPDVTHVINFDAPEHYDDYVHRIGRTGRANKKGNALTFVGLGA